MERKSVGGLASLLPAPASKQDPPGLKEGISPVSALKSHYLFLEQWWIATEALLQEKYSSHAPKCTDASIPCLQHSRNHEFPLYPSLRTTKAPSEGQILLQVLYFFYQLWTSPNLLSMWSKLDYSKVLLSASRASTTG